MTGPVELLTAAISETGLVRKNNEDAAYSGNRLQAVADGMGGHAAGEVASAAVIRSLRRHDVHVDRDDLLATLSRAVTDANASVAAEAAANPARRGMGTTLTALLWSDASFALANIGDSRAFRLRDGQLRQITEDHVMANLVSNAGPFAPVLSRYLDGRPDRSPDLSMHDAHAGDRYLICSDGLSPVVELARIQATLSHAAAPREALRQLVALAVEAGAPDNVTVVVIDVREAGNGHADAKPVVLGAAR
jgi:serine/threonine protein phosphatase PrpC